MSTITANLRRSVERGAALLDERGPADWRDRIDVTRLDTSSTVHCVVGQVFAPDHGNWDAWDRGLTSLGFPNLTDGRDAELISYGFEAPNETFGRPYDELNRAWYHYLTNATTPLISTEE